MREKAGVELPCNDDDVALLRDKIFLADIALGLLKCKLNYNEGVGVQLRGPLHCVAKKCKYFSQCQLFVCLGIVTS